MVPLPTTLCFLHTGAARHLLIFLPSCGKWAHLQAPQHMAAAAAQYQYNHKKEGQINFHFISTQHNIIQDYHRHIFVVGFGMLLLLYIMRV